MDTKTTMHDWRFFDGPPESHFDVRPWSVTTKAAPERIDIEAICPDGTKREIWIEISDGALVVHGYDPAHEEPINMRIGKDDITTDTDR